MAERERVNQGSLALALENTIIKMAQWYGEFVKPAEQILERRKREERSEADHG